VPEFWSNLGSTIWYAILIVVFVTYIMALFAIISDLFRDHKLSGVARAVWIIFLIVFPLVTALVYLIARGPGMSERAQQQAEAQKKATDAYIRDVAGGATGEIAHAKKLLDEGTIDQQEFERLKAKALS
jgi:NADH:ubiquinone oxidoreductase subunit 6 (subunit J)